MQAAEADLDACTASPVVETSGVWGNRHWVCAWQAPCCISTVCMHAFVSRTQHNSTQQPTCATQAQDSDWLVTSTSANWPNCNTRCRTQATVTYQKPKKDAQPKADGKSINALQHQGPCQHRANSSQWLSCIWQRMCTYRCVQIGWQTQQ